MKTEIIRNPKGSKYEWRLILDTWEVQFDGTKWELETEVKVLEREHFEQFQKEVKSADWYYCYANCTSEAYRRGEEECRRVVAKAKRMGDKYYNYLKEFRGWES